MHLSSTKIRTLQKRLEGVFSSSNLFAHKKIVYFFLFICLLFGSYEFGAHKIYGMIYYPDEFGYWANAAGWLGYDWSSLTALGSYYSFGYSLLLVPILKLAPDGLTAYRCAVALNVLLQGTSVFALYGIFRRMFPKLHEQTVVCGAGIASFYPVWMFYGLSTLAEGLLFCLYVWIVYLLLRVAEKPGTAKVLLLALFLLYLVFVHMRTVGVAAAGVFVLLCLLLREPAYRRKAAAGCGVLAVGLLLGAAARAVILGTVYRSADSEMMAANNVTGQISRVLDICSPEGIVRFLCGLTAKLFYLGSATFGLFYFAIAYLRKKCGSLLHALRHGGTVRPGEWTALFLLLSAAGQILVSAVFMNRPRRVDEVLYGRYNDYLLPVFMGLGFLFLYGHRLRVKSLAYAALAHTVMLPVAVYAVYRCGSDQLKGYFAAGISYAADDMHFDAAGELGKIWALSILAMCLLYFGIWLGRRFLVIASVASVLITAELLLGMRLNDKYTYAFNEVICREQVVCSRIRQADEDIPVTYVYGGRNTYIETVQLDSPDRHIGVVTEEEYLARTAASAAEGGEAYRLCDTPQEYLILDLDSECRAKLEQYAEPCVKSGSFALYLLGEESR